MIRTATSHRTLVLSCSATKCAAAGELPMLERYDGPAYRVLRSALETLGAREDLAGPAGGFILPNGATLRVLVLSAQFGLAPCSRRIADYDRKLDAERVAKFCAYPRAWGAEALTSELGTCEARELLVFGGELYRQAARAMLAFAGAQDDPRVRFTSGGIGEQLGQLKAWLLAAQPAPARLGSIVRRSSDPRIGELRLPVTRRTAEEIARISPRGAKISADEALEILHAGGEIRTDFCTFRLEAAAEPELEPEHLEIPASPRAPIALARRLAAASEPFAPLPRLGPAEPVAFVPPHRLRAAA